MSSWLDLRNVQGFHAHISADRQDNYHRAPGSGQWWKNDSVVLQEALHGRRNLRARLAAVKMFPCLICNLVSDHGVLLGGVRAHASI